MDVVQTQDRATLTDKKRPTKVRDKNVEKFEQSITEKDMLVDAKKLKKKLQKVAEKNETLSQTITDKNNEIADLKRSVQSLNEVLNSVPIDELRCNSSIASTKLLELSKRNRQLRAELEITKNRVSKKDAQIHKLEREFKAAEQKFQQEGDMLGRGNFTPIDELQSKVSSLQQKLFETRNKNVELQAQLKLAQKCLQQEVGESFNLNILASQSAQSNWRGRAQQILHLQQKLHELKERLEAHEHRAMGRSNSFSCPPLEPIHGTAHASVGQTTAATKAPLGGAESSAHTQVNQTFHMLSAGGNSHTHVSAAATPLATFDRFAPGVRKSEILHRAKVESLEKEIEALRGQLEEHRGKILALKVRNKTLNDEVLKYKMKSSTMEEQSDFNGINLATMNEKLNIQKYQFENRLEDMCRKLSDVERQRDEAQYKEEELRNRLENLEVMLGNKDEYLLELNAVIKKLEDDLKAVCGGFLFSCRELRKEEFIAILDSLETEKNHLLEHDKVLTERLEQERKKNENLSEQLARNKVRISRLDAKIRELEKELELQTERRKRSQRMSDYANNMNSFSSSVPSFVFENSSTIGSSIGDSSAHPLQAEEFTQAHVMDLKNQLEYATEKIALLDEKIAYLSAEKEDDAKTFHEIINNSKNIILGSILSQRNSHITNVPELEMP